MTIEERAKNIKLLLLDVDGILTDGKILYSNYGDELKNFDIYDGYGLVLLMSYWIGQFCAGWGLR